MSRSRCVEVGSGNELAKVQFVATCEYSTETIPAYGH